MKKDCPDVTKSYITHKELALLVQQTRLEEFRLLHMQDSYQSLIWETAYRNTNEEAIRGVKSGHKIESRGEGDQLPGVEPGNVVFEIE
ncbi:hypothetical protein NX059_012210 [Plenodomus lindquistii]|nr:hypothetical protein NX059_012210 [Plenodomus lindquistii]